MSAERLKLRQEIRRRKRHRRCAAVIRRIIGIFYAVTSLTIGIFCAVIRLFIDIFQALITACLSAYEIAESDTTELRRNTSKGGLDIYYKICN